MVHSFVHQFIEFQVPTYCLSQQPLCQSFGAYLPSSFHFSLSQNSEGPAQAIKIHQNRAQRQHILTMAAKKQTLIQWMNKKTHQMHQKQNLKCSPFGDDTQSLRHKPSTKTPQKHRLRVVDHHPPLRPGWVELTRWEHGDLT